MVDFTATYDEGTGVLSVWIVGSNDRDDWRFNFMTGRVLDRVAGVKVNRWDRYEALIVLREIRGELKRHGVDHRNICYNVAGHSRGGSIAQVVAWELLCTWLAPGVYLETFGSKRTGNRRFVREILRRVDFLPEGMGDVVHYKNRGDFVTCLPPWYARLRPMVKLPGKWAPVWKAHLRYDFR